MAHHFTKSVMDIQEQTLEAEKTRRLNPPNSSSTHIILQLQTTAEGGKLKRTPRERKTPWFEMNKGQNYNGIYTFIPASRSEICNMSLKRCTVGGRNAAMVTRVEELLHPPPARWKFTTQEETELQSDIRCGRTKGVRGVNPGWGWGENSITYVPAGDKRGRVSPFLSFILLRPPANAGLRVMDLT